MADNPIDSKTARRAGNPAKPKEAESWGELAKTVIYAGLIAIVHPHLPVPAVQYSVRLDGSHASGRRLSVRGEILLRL